MKKKILFLCLYLCVSLMSMSQNALCVYPKSGVDSLPIAFRVFARMAYYEDSLDITHRSGWLLYAAPYDDIQHIAFINHQSTYTFVYDTICAGETYTWNGNTYSRPGVYVDTLQNIYGCDSIVELQLEVLPDPALTFTVNGVSFNMMRVRAGSFMMGATEKDTEAEVDEFPLHQVTLTRDYFIAETEMTQELWSAIMGSNPSADKSNLQSPVNMVTWDDCQQMIVKLNQLTGLTFRLPTEAEWEYAARGGQYSKGYKYAGSDNIDEVAWYNGGYYYPVAQLKPNELGLFDMSGNVYEWCQDQYHDKAYTSTPCIDPLQLVSSNGMRCVRGGSNSMAQSNREIYTRIANRGHHPDNDSIMYIGLRLALEATGILENNSVFVTYDTICSGETYTWNGEEYTRPGVYSDTLQNIYGCDSIVELRLEVLPDPAISFTVNGVSFNMIRVRAGSSMMGATPEQGDDALENEKPAHQVTLTRDYFIAETMLTQELWTAVMGTTIQEEEAKRSRGEENLGYGPNYPMYCLSHNDCLDFVEKLNALTGLTFRMPTEAEWEYAARGGHLSKGYKYPGSNDPLEVAWSDVNAPDRKLREVKLLKPNELGVFDMAGNVWEYIYDYRRTYTADAQVDPLGDIDGNMANIRGGSTAWDTRYNRVSCRYAASGTPKTDKSSRRAFRFVLDADRVIGEDNMTYQVYDTICAGETYTWNGNTYSRPGVYVDTLQNIYGCDSIVELRLEVLPDPALTFTVNGVSFNMRRVRAGSFMMGATEKDTIAEIDEFPLHQVTLTRDYFIAETEMTQELWSAIMGSNPSADKSNPQSPVNMVTWDDCQQMIAKLNELTGLTFRLPTEAEWEYAARGGQYSKGYKYAGSDNIDEVAWYNKSYYASVASLKPNELGLYDMSGSVYEWCQDYFNPNFYSSPNHQVDPFQSESVDGKRCARGGSNKESQGNDCKFYSRIANRGYSNKFIKEVHVGLRLALEATGILENNSVFVTNDTICSGDVYVWNGKKYYYSGNYVDTLQNIYGCDSIVELHLTVHPSYNNHETVVACGSYEFNPFNIEGGGRILSKSGIYSDTIATIHGCDSIATIDLTVMPEAVTTIESVVIGSNELPYIWRGTEYNATGTYIDKEKFASAECDSAIHYLELTVLTTGAIDEQTKAVCESALPYEWYGQSLTATGSYTHTEQYVGTEIDSVQHILHFVVNPTQYSSESKTICFGESYTWNGNIYTLSDDYTVTLSDKNGCDSVVTLHLTVLPEAVITTEKVVIGSNELPYIWRGKEYNISGTYTDKEKFASAECDSAIHYLELTVLTTGAIDEQTMAVCESALPYEWYGQELTSTGSYSHIEQYVGTEIDSVQHILHFVVNPTQYSSESKTICFGESYTWSGNIYTSSDDYTVTLSDKNGCDSVVTLHLIVLPEAVITTETAVIGSNELPYIWRGKEYNISGTYTDKELFASAECDSAIHYLELTVLTTGAIDEQTMAVCESALPYEWYGQSLTATGSYSHIEQYVGTTIDSVQHILHFVVNPTQYSSESKTICFGESYTWNGNIYTSSDDYTVTLSDKNGCDSVVTLHLTVLPEAVTTTEKVVIGSNELPYIWRGKEYNISGTYTDKELFASAECDSAIHYLELTVLTTGAIDEQTKAVCESALPYEWYGQELTLTGSYTHTEQYVGTAIDSVQHILHFVVNPTQYSSESKTICFGESYTWNGNIYTSSDDYTVTLSDKNGCDSVVTLHLTVLPEAVTTIESVVIGSNELPYIWRGKEYNESGTYIDEYKYVSTECDSAIYVLELTVLTTGAIDEQTKAVCESALPYEWYGQELTSTGSYSHIEQYVGTTIDSVQHILHFVVNPTQYSNESKTICFGESYTWNGNIYTSSDDYTVTLSDKNGCDSVVTLHLTVLPKAVTITETAVIGSNELPYIWRGKEYNISGTYTDKEKFASAECDSAIHYLELTVLTTGAIDEQTKAVCESALPYEWYGQSLIATGSYSHIEQYVGTAIDSVQHILHFVVNPTQYSNESKTICFGESYTWNGNIYTSSDDYTVTLSDKNGCDSVVTLHLTVLPKAVITTEIAVIGSNELPYIWRGQQYIASGTYTDKEKFASAECDSAIYVLELTVLTTGAIDEQTKVVCESALPYEWYGQELTSTGSYSHIEQYVGTEIDSVQHILHFVVNPTQYSSESKTICFGESYTWNGNIYTSSDDYTVTLSDKNGCDSVVTLHLTVLPEAVITTDTVVIGSNELPYIWRGKEYNISGTYTDKEKFASAECDSAIYVLELTVLTTGAIDEQTKVVCESALPYEWYGQELTSTGSYSHIEQYVGTTIDSVQHILHFVVNPTLYSSESKTICFGESYTWNGNIYTSSDDYTVTLSDKNGCDSVVTLHLTVLPEAVTTTEKVVIGSNELPYIWRGKEYNISGTYTDKELFASAECDSAIHYLELTVLTTGAIDEQTKAVCESALPYEWYGQSLTATGSYTHTEQYVGTEIDSVQHILHFVVNPIYVKEEFVTECDSYTWSNGNTYTESGIYYDSLKTIYGCDSVVTLYLTINHTSYFAYDTAVCGSYLFVGEELIESGTYIDTIANAAGCDSIITLNLTIYPITPTEYIYDTICSDELPYIFNDLVYDATGVYTHTYQNQYGCDSTIVLMLEVVERLIVEVDSLPNLCAGDGELVINYDVLQGEFDSLQIRFLNDTVPAELYTQTIYENSISEVVYTFDSTIWVDRYIVQLEFYQNSACGNQVFELPFDIQYDASIIVQKWNTFLALQNANYNGGYTFTEYQWYKNDEPIPGATKASLHQDLDSTACYHALLTRDDGLVMRTCDYCPTLDQGFPEFPTLVKSSQHIYVTNTAYTSPIETITIYSEVGQLISVTKLVNGEGDVIMPFVEGNYITKIQTMDGQIISQMLVVLW